MSVEIKGTVEFPKEAIEVAQKRILIKGWAYATDGSDVQIRAVIDEENTFRGKWGLARFDVFEMEKNEYAYESGFFIELKIPEKFDIEMKVQVFAGPVDSPVWLGEFCMVRSDSRKARKLATADTNKYKFQFVPAGPSGSVRKTRKPILEKIHARGKLRPTDSVLEIGPGFGRFALPITQFLQPDGQFKGLDILPQAVKYCNFHIGSRYKNFEVRLVDVKNRMYNKSGQLTGADYRFPFDDSEFDVIFLQSVFTHMMFPDVANYIAEISRVLKPGAHCIATFYILDDVARQQIEKGKANRNFRHQEGDSYADVKQKPEAAVAFDELLVRETYAKHGLTIIDPIEPGGWRGIKADSAQDTVVCRKPG